MATVIDATDKDLALAVVAARYDRFLREAAAVAVVRSWSDLNPQQRALFHAAYLIGVSDGQTGVVTLSAPLPGSREEPEETPDGA